MTISEAQIGVEVVRSKGDYVVGRTGSIVAIDADKKRAQVAWEFGPTTWVALASMELTSIPYEMLVIQKDKYSKVHKYKRIA